MGLRACVIGGGLAGCECALVLARNGIDVDLFEMRPGRGTPVHAGGSLAELVCSNSLKSEKTTSAAGLLKMELEALESPLLSCAHRSRVPAGGALAVDREAFSESVELLIDYEDGIDVIRKEITGIPETASDYDAVILATGPLSSDALAESLQSLIGTGMLSFYDAAAPIVMADSLDTERLFRQDRYGADSEGDYLNAALSKEEYYRFIDELVSARKVLSKDFEGSELFQACQPIEEIARKGADAPRFGPMKPVGLTDPVTGRRPWAAVQLRAEDAAGQSYNLVGFQTNLAFPEQERVFRMIPGLEQAEFARLGVMHRNTFVDAPKMLDNTLKVVSEGALSLDSPVYIAGQLSGTEGYCEAIRSGHHAALSVISALKGMDLPRLPEETVFGALVSYATDRATADYQPMHVNFGIMKPLENAPRKKAERYSAYSKRATRHMDLYVEGLHDAGIA